MTGVQECAYVCVLMAVCVCVCFWARLHPHVDTLSSGVDGLCLSPRQIVRQHCGMFPQGISWEGLKEDYKVRRLLHST